MNNDTYYTVEDRNEVWFKTDDCAFAHQFVNERADEDPSYACNLRVVRHQQSTGMREIIYWAQERITEMYGE